MKPGHDEIKERLPEYIKGEKMPEETKKHIEECTECREDFSLLKTLNELEAPEPGGMFFEVLPQRVRVSLEREERKNKIFRLVPAFALLLIVLTAGYFSFMKTAGVEDSFTDPFVFESFDISGLSEEDIPSIGEYLEDDEVAVLYETSYYEELASLSSEEMESLYEVLTAEYKEGGVL